jgi:hypothetical protein
VKAQAACGERFAPAPAVPADDDRIGEEILPFSERLKGCVSGEAGILGQIRDKLTAICQAAQAGLQLVEVIGRNDLR